MEFVYEWRPLEIIRRAKLYFDHWKNDFDLRFPEIRSRKIFELRLLQVSERAIEEISAGLRSFELDRKVVPLLDIWILAEWNLRYRFYFLKAELIRANKDLLEAENDLPEELFRALRTQLQSLSLQLERLRLSYQPGSFELARVRFRMSQLDQELSYLQTRIPVRA